MFVSALYFSKMETMLSTLMVSRYRSRRGSCVNEITTHTRTQHTLSLLSLSSLHLISHTQQIHVCVRVVLLEDGDDVVDVDGLAVQIAPRLVRQEIQAHSFP